MTCGVYKIYNTIEDKCYIGQSLDIENRWKGHVNELKKGKHINKKLQLAFDKYGIEAFEFSILKEVEDLIWIDYYESYYTEKYNAVNGGYSVRKLHSSQDIKFVLDNLDNLKSKWLQILKTITTKYYCIDKQVVANKLGITEKQVAIFIRYFEADEYKCRMNFDTVDIIYFDSKYIDESMKNFGL